MARTHHPCAAPGCQTVGPVKRGFCEFHYRRFMAGRPFDAPAKAPAGSAEQEIDRAVASQTAQCIEWSMALMGNGYPLARHRAVAGCREGHRIVCILAHGEPPKLDLQAAHSCGNRRCINPRHLRWATAKENAADRDEHQTTVRGERQIWARTTEAQARQIIAMLGTGKTARQIAATVGASVSSVQKISCGHTWKWLPR